MFRYIVPRKSDPDPMVNSRGTECVHPQGQFKPTWGKCLGVRRENRSVAETAVWRTGTNVKILNTSSPKNNLAEKLDFLQNGNTDHRIMV
jgi:hypothetical protein